jgi:DNA-directed RNA polymerase subunit M/transcription elongation factor TFIIS
MVVDVQRDEEGSSTPPERSHKKQWHSLRDQARAYLHDVIMAVDVVESSLRDHDDNTAAGAVREMETAVFNRALEKCDALSVTRSWSNPLFLSVYRSVLRFVLSNLDASCYVENRTLAPRLVAVRGADKDASSSALLRPRDVPFLRAEDAFPPLWNDIVLRSRERDQYIMTARPSATTDQFKCARCKQRQCSYVEVQTRSCDEPASIFVTCHGCGNRWRIG